MDYNSIIKFISNVLSTPWLTSLFTIILSGYLTYLFTKHKFKNEKVRDIKSTSLEKAYLPLYRKLENINSNKISKKEAIIIYSFIYSCTEKNYIYIHPTLYFLLKDLKMSIDIDTNYNDIVYRIKLHIKNEYIKLRKHLGYPSYNYLKAFRYSSGWEKIIYLLIFSLFSFVSSLYIYKMVEKIIFLQNITIIWCALSIILFFISIIIGIFYKIYKIIIKIIEKKYPIK